MKSVVIEGKSQQGFERECKYDGDCFVAGTLVHTDKGLVPIEQLKVGDMVLSKHESGEGEQAYKAITRTFKSQEKQPIFMVSFRFDSVMSHIYEEEYPQEYRHKIEYIQRSNNHIGVLNTEMYLFCTSDHPFWVVGKGWIPVYQLREYDQFALFDGDTATINSVYDHWPRPLEATANPDIAICPNYEAEDAATHKSLIDFRFGCPQLILDKEERERNMLHPSEKFIIIPSDSSDPLSKLLRPEGCGIGYADDFTEDNINYLVRHFYQYVYNIEVEDFHTYYVGHAGIWVHNT